MQTDPGATDDARLGSQILKLTEEITRQRERSASQIEQLQLQLRQIERSEEGSQDTLLSLERILADLKARVYVKQHELRDPILEQDIHRLGEAQSQMASRVETLHEDFLKLQLELMRREAHSDCCDRISDLESRIHNLETNSNSPDYSKWAGNVISFFGIVVGVALGVFITPYITRRADRRKYTLQTWESFLKMYPEIETAQASLRNPQELTSESFAQVQAVRTWMSAFILFVQTGVLDDKLVRDLKLGPAMGHFVDLLEAAVTQANQPHADPRSAQWATDLANELNLADDIKKFSKGGEFHGQRSNNG